MTRSQCLGVLRWETWCLLEFQACRASWKDAGRDHLRFWPSEVHVVIGNVDKTRGKKQEKRVHVNTCKSFTQAQINRVAMWDRGEDNMEPVGKLETLLQLSETRKRRLDECVERWSGKVVWICAEVWTWTHWGGNPLHFILGMYHLWGPWLIRFRVSGRIRLGRT